jgi:hypothetical protein
MKLGNFAFYKSQFVILIAEQETLMGTVWTTMNLETKAITLVNEQDLTAYSRKPRGVKPASNMTDHQQKAIDFIQQLTGAYFNGRSLSDVSTFIGLFLNRAKNKDKRQAFADWIIADATVDTVR